MTGSTSKIFLKIISMFSNGRCLHLFVIFIFFFGGCAPPIMETQKRPDPYHGIGPVQMPVHPPSPSQKKNLIRDFDVNGDSVVSRQEFPGPFEVFNRLDINSDGVITKVEAAADAYGDLTESKTIKFSFKPDAGETYIQDKDIDNLFEKAKETGPILNYSVLNEQEHNVTFAKEKTDRVFIKVNVIVKTSDNRKIAYVFFTVSSNLKLAVEDALFEFKEMYKSSLNSVKNKEKKDT